MCRFRKPENGVQVSGMAPMSRSRNSRKQWNKPNSTFKTLRKRKRRAQERSAMNNDREIPLWRKTDQWDWN